MKKTTPKNNSLLIILFVMLVMLGAAITYNKFGISPEMKELASMRNEDSFIQKEQRWISRHEDIIKKRKETLRKRIKEFNVEIEKILNSREKYPADEPIPKKFNLSQ